MESLTESSSSSKPGFFKHVFNFDSDSKAEMLNIIQYAILALIPIIILNKLMQKYIPEADEEKGSLEISVEVLLQVIIIVLGIFFVDRLVTFVPTYSGIKYLDFSVTTVVIATLLILLSLQTKLGEKISLLFDRVMELWDGPSDKDDKKKKGKGKGSVKVSQPISGQGQQQMQQQPSPDQSAQMQSLYGGSTPINQLPSSSTTSQQLPNYNEMYNQADQNPLVGAATPGGFGESMIMAANEALGGSAFGSNF
jgi:hypothetical protein